MYARVDARMYVCKYVCTHVHMYVCLLLLLSCGSGSGMERHKRFLELGHAHPQHASLLPSCVFTYMEFPLMRLMFPAHTSASASADLSGERPNSGINMLKPMARKCSSGTAKRQEGISEELKQKMFQSIAPLRGGLERAYSEDVAFASSTFRDDKKV